MVRGGVIALLGLSLLFVGGFLVLVGLLLLAVGVLMVATSRVVSIAVDSGGARRLVALARGGDVARVEEMGARIATEVQRVHPS